MANSNRREMTSTTTAPTVEGHFWFRRTPASEWHVIEVVEMSGALHSFVSGTARKLTTIARNYPESEWGEAAIPEPETHLDCPHCDNSGTVVNAVWNPRTGEDEPEPEPCEWCYRNPKSKFNDRAAEPQSDLLEDPDYQRHLDELAKDCRCCPECWDVPCGACQAGAPCDEICTCDQFDYT